MTDQNYLAAAELYLGSSWRSANALGPRTFRTVAAALRFALEEAAPVSLRGARLKIGGRTFKRPAMLQLYESATYPLARKNVVRQ
jgi:hypothetical protein